MSTPEPHGIEAQVCADIASRQKLGMSKYGTSVADNPLTETQWLQHAYEEALDLSIYLKRIVEMKTTTASSHRPFNLPPELPNPPEPPAGMRGVYRGIKKTSVHFWVDAVEVWQPMSAGLHGFGGHYIEYIPLRPVPDGVAQPTDGWEYHSYGELPKLQLEFQKDALCLGRFVKEWHATTGGICHLHYALRIGSELHHRHFDADEAPAPQFRFFKDRDGFRYKMPGFHMVPGTSNWVSSLFTMMDIERKWEVDGTIETDAGGNPLGDGLSTTEVIAKQPAKAREFAAWESDSGKFLLDRVGPLGEGVWKLMLLREVIPGEADLLAEAVGHLRAVLPFVSVPDGAEADAWLSTNFPEPAPEPFDMDKLWGMLPPWINHLQQQETGKWWGFSVKPTMMRGDIYGDGRMPIPPEFAPPPAADWKTSLVKRPTPASHE